MKTKLLLSILLLLGFLFNGNAQNATYFNHPNKHNNKSGIQHKYANGQSHMQLLNNSKSFSLRKYDAANNIVWEYNSPFTSLPGFTIYMTSRDFHILPNGHILVVGDSLVFGSVAFSSITFFITEFDDLGNRLWTKNHLFTTFYSFESTKITPINDSTLAVFGGSNKFIIDLAGNILNHKLNYSLQEDYIMKDTNTFYQLLHLSTDYLAKVDAQLDTVWTTKLDFRGQQLIDYNNALYVAGIFEANDGTSDLRIAKFSELGQKIFDHTIHHPDISEFRDITIYNGNLFVAGNFKDCQNTNVDNTCAGQFKSFIIERDTNGNSLNQYVHEDSTFTNIHNLDSGYHSKAVKFVVNPNDQNLYLYGNKEGFDLVPSFLYHVYEYNTVDNPFSFMTNPISAPTFTHSTELKRDITVSPNPVFDQIQIHTEQFSRASIYDLSGKLLLESDKAIIQLHSLHSGIYFVKVIADNGFSHSIKFIKH